ncbi:nodulation factor fucose acetyltransferase NolL [Mesorhizobium sp. M0185]|uniref:nodulation factor fucose acetyltransferase NolL n=1 Tax=Mesorhizobium sp. M0185 TaxID=2956907 RepID=UPI00333AE0EA
MDHHITVGSKGRDSRQDGTKVRDLGFDFAKGVLIILVIIGHLLQYVIYRGTDDFWLSPYFKSIYMFHMPLFMAISGYLSSGAILRKSFPQGVIDRARQLVLPMFWCALIWLSKAALMSSTTSLSGGMLDFLREFIGTYWFIWAAFASFVLIKLLTTFNGSSVWIIGASAIAIAFAPVPWSITPLVRYTYPFFCLGFLFAQPIGWQAASIRRHKAIFVVLLSMAAFMCFLVWGKETYVYNNLVLIYDAQSAKQVLLMFDGSVASSAVAMQLIFLCWRVGYSTRVAHFVAVELGQSTLLLYLLQGAVFRFMDLIRFGELWDLTSRIGVATLLGAAIVVTAMTIRRIVRELGYVSRSYA